MGGPEGKIYCRPKKVAPSKWIASPQLNNSPIFVLNFELSAKFGFQKIFAGATIVEECRVAGGGPNRESEMIVNFT